MATSGETGRWCRASPLVTNSPSGKVSSLHRRLIQLWMPIGGWQVSGILTYGSGTPEQISATGGGVNTLNIWAVRNQSVPLTGTTSCTLYNPRFIGAPELHPILMHIQTQQHTLLGTRYKRRSAEVAESPTRTSFGKELCPCRVEGRKLQELAQIRGKCMDRHTWSFSNEL